MGKNSGKTFSSDDEAANTPVVDENVTETVADVKQEELAEKPAKKIYGGPTIVSLGISKGTTYCGIPAGVPEHMHFMFLPISEYRATVQSAAFVRKCTAAIKKLKEA